jgi:hypothetical protein
MDVRPDVNSLHKKKPSCLFKNVSLAGEASAHSKNGAGPVCEVFRKKYDNMLS